MPSEGHSTGQLVLISTTAFTVGTTLGLVYKREILSLLSALGLGAIFSSIPSTNNRKPSPSPSIRTSDLPEDADPEVMANTRIAIVVRSDELKDAGELICHASRTVLGQFKKLYKRKDVNLKLWEGGGQKMEVRVASTEAVLVAVQEAARAAGLSTHTFAGKHGPGGIHNKQRSLMVVGPAQKAALYNIVGKLELA